MSFGLLVVLTAVVASPPDAVGRSHCLFDWTGIDYAFVPSDAAIDIGLLTDQPTDAGPPETPALEPFGTMGSKRWSVQGGPAVDFDGENKFGLFGAGFSYFLVDDLSIELELNLLYFSQEGDDAVGGNFNVLFRWHFFRNGDWTLYGDGGAGVLGTSARVPGPTATEQGGANFNFTPQIGVGLTYQLPDNARFFAGVRLHHISNARTHHPNPPRNSMYIYAGVSFGF